MSAPRTVTVHTRDHGPVTLTCPTWCTTAHPDGGYRVDISHTGDETGLTLDTTRGTAYLMPTFLEQRPYTEQRPPGRGLFINIGLDGDFYPSDPAQLHGIAEALIRHGAQLHALAGHLAALLREEGSR
ncbi:DUF6907 domain-containing protein [Streptomyces rapamycinicus]|uniref:Uncharacterized protein n=2 Tax=Streptomyces rapamycinicus TaxID=1226757 RepID=A0A0A0NG00_STRRN|nr:hypothetical protein [Streptomyces rapamycinicus]AGP56171.1 hypothetical protein M271_23285 [Streptomyces rapamycinicus NRRL 5491]MBB4783778.1 hypothetical protein [Streptomyces rapamycinicus]RLV80751.1 hypothetical protein D3C57_120240 [Streptomyces rapamycinicus NRRL 5491]UTO64135.1 hypothetical protein LJB45_18585 [Streptomyces rapamycinicus]UTP32090.1 hypothetical protein LIV37_23705 [Streptomyces rapamycinicus NRRL 5491]